MKVRELMKELIDLDPDTEIKILVSPFSMPDGKRYLADIDVDSIDYDDCQAIPGPNNFYYMFFSPSDFKNDNGGTLIDLLRQCKPTGDGLTEFPEYLKGYDNEL